MPALIHKRPDGTERKLEIGSKPLIIGRLSESEIQVRDAFISRVHDDGPFLERNIGTHSHLETICNAFATSCPSTKKVARLDSRKRGLLQPCVRKSELTPQRISP